jgi:hypothetical protein
MSGAVVGAGRYPGDRNDDLAEPGLVAALRTGLDPQLLLEAVSFVVDLQRDDTVPEFPAVRRILEPAATALAATRVPEREPDALS